MNAITGVLRAAEEAPQVSPGVIGFAATAIIAVFIILLLIDLARRVRRVNQRAMIREQLEAEYAAREAGELSADDVPDVARAADPDAEPRPNSAD